MEFAHLGQIRLWFDITSAEVINPHIDHIKNASNDWLTEKQTSYYGTEYISELEDNCIYLAEGYSGTCQMITRVLHEGKPLFSNESDMLLYYAAVKTYFGKVHYDCFISYLREGKLISQCQNDIFLEEVKKMHIIRPIYTEPTVNRYDKLRKIRISGDSMKYIDELEFDCKFWHAALMVNNAFLFTLFYNPQFAGAASRLPLLEVLHVVEERTMQHTALNTDQLQIQIPDEVINELKKKRR